MKLVTFQSMEALKALIDTGYLICDEKFVDIEKAGVVYDWVAGKMTMQMENPAHAKYPIWAWVKCYSRICPPRRRGQRVRGFDVKITFHKAERDVFVTDFRRYSFLLNYVYIPEDLEDKRRFEEKMKECGVSADELRAFARRDKYKSHRTDQAYLQLCEQIRQSFDRCITKNSDILQGCVWSVSLKEVESVEILKDDGYVYGSLNYKRANGKRKDWISDFYKTLE